MAKNSFDFEAHLSRHPHNVSAGYTSSLAPGPIVPQYTDILGPGDTIYFTPKCFARMQDIAAPFFGEVDIHFDAFFVPLQMIYTAFGQVFAQTSDTISSLYETGTGISGNGFPLMKTDWCDGKDLRGKYYGHSECLGKETMRLLDALDCNPLSVYSGANFTASGAPEGVSPISFNMLPVVSPWLFAAYQACYQKFYRNDDLERFDINSYNIDRYFNNYSVQSPFTQDRLWRLRYVQRPNDYFTSVKVSPIASAVNSVGMPVLTDDPSDIGSRFPSNGGTLMHTLEKVNDYLGFGSNYFMYEKKRTDNENIYPISDNDTFTIVGNSDSFSASSVANNVDFYPTAANIRALFAVDKFTRIYGRAGKTYDEQIEAHFGIKIPHDVKHDLTHIKHWRMALSAEPVYSTADTGDGGSSLGQVGGQSNGTLNAKQEKFTAPVHGVFIINAYAVTKPRYFMTFNKLNLLMNRLDFPIPEFDKLGMQPLYAYEVYPLFLQYDDDSSNPNSSVRIGWQRRYQQFKQKYNRVSPLYYNSTMTDDIPSESNFFSPYVLSRIPVTQDTILNEGSSTWLAGQSMLIPSRELFELPQSLNGVMAVSYSGDWSSSYWTSPQSVFDTDPILMDFYCDAKKVSWMSETGEPDL